MKPIVILSYFGLLTIIFCLEKSRFRRIIRIGVRNTCSQANHPVIKTENGFTGHKVWCEVLIIPFCQFHSEHSIFTI